VRIEELVNYFPYEYAGPKAAGGEEPFAFDSELSSCPWNPSHSLLRIALQAKRITDREIPPSNLVFLIDVSGSMEDENKLPLVKEALKILARRMRQEDRISIVVYAGSAGIVLEPTAGSKTATILRAIDELESGGSTAGGEGIRLAYEAAKKAFIPKGSNRVVLATDGDFNIGASSDGELVRIIEEERKAGIFLTVLGFGMGNYKDSKMQKLADSGNGNYAYVDSLSEAEKVLSKQMAGTLYAVAKDVKVQIEFNPAVVGEYRLVGYEKRALAARDFADDAKDAGELGAGSSVTALYELKAAKGAASRSDLKYQSQAPSPAAASSGELMTIKFRYKKPDGDKSILVEKPVSFEKRELSKTGEDYRFAAAVAEWGLILRESQYKGSASFAQVEKLASGARGRDEEGYRSEFLRLVRLSEKLGKD
jgi:Ca-activated chloride channel family protein